jgi:hypothetical protein
MSGRIGDRTPTPPGLNQSRQTRGRPRCVVFVILVRQASSPSKSGGYQGARNCGVYCRVVMPLVPSRMEDSMCYEIDYEIFAAQRKAQEARIKQEQRAGVIDKLLNEANKQGDDTKTEGTPVNEVIPAK